MTSLPKDDNSVALQLTPSRLALAETYDTTVSSETNIVLNTGTKLVEVSAINSPIFMKYKVAEADAAVSSTNFDEFIQAGMTRHYSLTNLKNINGITVLAFIEQATGAVLVVIEK